MADLASRLNNRVQISTDAMVGYEDAIELAFGSEVDYAQIVKAYASEDRKYDTPERKYSPTRIESSKKNWITGSPDPNLVSTSYVERLNASTRLHVRRLSRLTLAFSKKKANFYAAGALNFASHNF